MKKKMIIGSIIAVVILVLVSFTGVVGYQTIQSSSIAKASPLFKVRTNRAIGEDSKDITCKYIGKGYTLPFPERDDRALIVKKVIDRISKMDDETFERFIAYLINNTQKDNRFIGVNPDKIREALNLLKDSDKPLLIFDADTKQFASYGPGFPCPLTQGVCPVTLGFGIKGIFLCILALPLAVFFAIYLFVNGVIPTAFICPVPTLEK